MYWRLDCRDELTIEPWTSLAAHATCAIAAFALGLVTAWPSRRKRQLARVVRSQCQGRFGVIWMNKRATRRQYSKGPQVARLPVA